MGELCRGRMMDPWTVNIDRERFAPLRPGIAQMTVAIGVGMLGEDGKRFAERQGEIVNYMLAMERWSSEHRTWRAIKASAGRAQPVSDIRHPNRGSTKTITHGKDKPEPKAPAMSEIYQDFSNTLMLRCGRGLEEVRLQDVVVPLSRSDSPIRVFAIRNDDGLAHSCASRLTNDFDRRQAIDKGFFLLRSDHRGARRLGIFYTLAISREDFDHVLASGDLHQGRQERLGEQTPFEHDAKKRGVPGRPDEYPWQEISDAVAHRILDIGHPDKSNDERDENGNYCWRTKAHVVRFIQQYCFNSPTIVCDRPDLPARKTIEKRWPDFLRRADELRRIEIAKLKLE
ncbi:MAG: hypothetical protein RJQ21_02365 [Rhodospirillales bacterium]